MTLDQFETEPNMVYSGTYGDSIFVGSIFDANGRFPVASHASGSVQRATAKFHSFFQDYSGSLQNRDRGVSFRFTQHLAPAERFQDSIMPDILECYKLNGGKLALAMQEYFFVPVLVTDADGPRGANQPVGKMIFSSHGATGSLRVGGGQVADDKWLNTFPFEQRYASVTRGLDARFRKSSIVCECSESYGVSGEIRYDADTGTAFSSSLLSVEVILPPWAPSGPGVPPSSPSLPQSEPVRYTFFDVTGSVSAVTGRFNGKSAFTFPPASEPDIFFTTFGTVKPNEKQIIKFLYGFGDNYQGTAISTAVTSSKITSIVGVFNGFYTTTADIRGWKYGVFNAFPQYNTAVYRNNRFGQFRDMLEQRKQTKFYNEIANDRNLRVKGKLGSTESSVEISFISGSAARLSSSNPSVYNTNGSGIYDFQAKTGKPFYDQ